MAKANDVTIFLLFFFCFTSLTFVMVKGEMQKSWCVAKPSSDKATLLANIDFACSHVDCRILQGGCPCASPDNLMNHASITINLYYQAMGRNQWNCDFKCSGLIVMTNPSYGDCLYAYA